MTSRHQKLISLRDPRVAAVVTLLVGVAVWGLSKAALSTVFEYSVASSLKKTQVNTFRDDPHLTLEKAGPVYATHRQYISSIYHTRHGFNAVGFRIDEDIPPNTKIDIFVRTGTSGEPSMSDWIEVARDEDGFFSEQSAVYSELIPVSTSYDVQYKADLHTDDVAVTPTLNGVEIVYINSSGYWTNVLETTSLSLLPKAYAATTMKIISRQAWGADESLRVYSPSRPAPQLLKLTQEMIEQFSNENPIVKRVNVNEKGESLTWPLEYAATVDKIVIHHTAKQAPATPADAVAYLRAVYYYHTISRGWGDIGYNYVIDPFGNVYEGRYGGDRVVGAHAGLSNRGSIGIAVMGDFGSETISAAEMRSLIQLLRALTKKYGIDPRGQSMFRGKLMPNIVGHRDTMTTACPGEALYGLLPAIRNDVAGSGEIIMDQILKAPQFIKDMEHQPVQTTTPVIDDQVPHQFSTDQFQATPSNANPSSVVMKTKTTVPVTFTFTNTGTATWDSKTYLLSTLKYPGLRVGNDDRTAMKEAQVRPGENATFVVQLTTEEEKSRRYTLAFDLMLNGYALSTNLTTRLIVDVSLNTSESGEVSAANDQAVTSAVTTSPQAPQTSQKAFASALSAFPRTQNNTIPDTIRVKLTTEGREVVVSSAAPYRVYAGTKLLSTVDANEDSRVTYGVAHMKVVVDAETYTTDDPIRFESSNATPLQIVNLNRQLPWDTTINDNVFRGILEVQRRNNALLVINELSVEEYLNGVAEVSESSTHNEKKKAMAVVARSYALYYVRLSQKFPGEPYHLDDLASSSQKYLGYAFELRSPQWVQAVTETRGMVVTYGGVLVKTPYFSQSDGRTRSAQEVWGWTDTPYLQSIPDPLCAGKQLLGHGVGLSGCGAEVAAQQGHLFKDILGYYYRGTTVRTLY